MVAANFDKVPVDRDTKITFHEQVILGAYEVLHQKWTWDGISAESIIFIEDEVSELTDQEVKHIVFVSPLNKNTSSMTLKRGESGFVFVNFNFESS